MQDLGFPLLYYRHHCHLHDHLLDLLFDCPSKEVDCSVFDCCSFITTKKENKKIKKN
jgi:hypothetical protein